ncbi:HEAT repeat domain-containing protein [Streptomyces sp. p1417]|uniref:HEAT repeat domain-containing protein n=1 Tax=Streptomyces typhae TaxID=2681492 RepID=A0A6L6WY22_9ACTN|nr:HEAT repeat domain-containing protein [Streptomyces typhae]
MAAAEAASVADLVRMRMDGDVQGLCRATRSGEHAVRLHATELLGSSTGSPEVVETLLTCLRRRGDPYPGVRWQAARALGRLRVRRAVPELLVLLGESRDDRDQLDGPVVEALVAIGGPEAVRGLVGLCGELATGHGYWTIRVLDALAVLRPPEAVHPLLVALWEYLPERAEPVVRTLGAIGDPRATSALLNLAHTPSPGTHLRLAAVRALHALPDIDWPSAHWWPPAETLLHAPQRDPDPETARLATALLSRTEDGRAHLWDVLRRAAGSRDPECPPHAVAAACDGIAAEPALFAVPERDEHIALLRHHLREAPAPPVRRAAAEALAAYAGTEAAGPLLAALGDAHIGDAVADLVAGLPGPLPELVDLCTRPDGPAARRAGAARVSGLRGCADAAPALLSVLTDDTAPTRVRASAADALGALRYARAATPLAALAADEEQPGTLRAHAVRALGRIGAPDTLPTVLACARSPHEAVRGRAVAALGGFPVPEAVRALGASVTPDTEPDLARTALRALVRIGTPALPVLLALTDDVDALPEDLGERLVAALAAHPEDEATAALSRIAAAPAPDRGTLYATAGEGRLTTARPAHEAASLALPARATAGDLTPATALLAPDTWTGAHEPAAHALLKIGTKEAHDHVLTHCLTGTYLRDWQVAALDAIAEARGVRLGP